MDRHPDVVVIGGGVIGCAVARALAPDRDVLVVEKGRIAGEASGLAAGNVNPALSYPDRPPVARHVRDWFERFDGTGDVRFTRRPRLELVEAGAGETARDRAADLRDRGLPVSFLDAERVESDVPAFDLEGYAGAIRYGDGGWVDPYTYTVALRRKAADRGAAFETGTPARSIAAVDGRPVVRTTDADLVSDHVVVATGWRTGALLAGQVALPVRPFLTQCVVLEPGSALGSTVPMGRDPRSNLYFRPEPGGDLLVGGGRSAAIDDPERASAGIDATAAFRSTVAEAVPRFLRGFDAAGVVDGWAGVDAATPDGHPIVAAPAAGPAGLVVATGFHGGGIRDSPVAASVVRSIVLEEPLPFDGTRFALSRFDSRSSDFSVSKEYDDSTTV